MNQTSKQRILVLQGPPASRKSTFVKNFIKEHPDYIIVDRDEIRGDYLEHRKPAQLILQLMKDEIISAINSDKNVIIDGNNLESSIISEWKLIADNKNCDIEFKSFWPPFYQCLINSVNADRKVFISASEIYSFYRRYNIGLIPSENKKTIICNLNDINDSYYNSDWFIKLLKWLNKSHNIIFIGEHNYLIKYSEEFKDYILIKYIDPEFYNKWILPYYNVVAIYDIQRNKMWKELNAPCYNGNL